MTLRGLVPSTPRSLGAAQAAGIEPALRDTLAFRLIDFPVIFLIL